MQARAEMFHAARRVVEEMDVEHAQAVTHRGVVMQGHHFFQKFGGFLVLALIVLDDAQQIERLGIVHIQGAGALGESLGGLPVLGLIFSPHFLP